MINHPASISTRRRFLQQSVATAAALSFAPHSLRAADGSAALVHPPSGKLAGEVSNGIRIFRGIPFASPPVGKLRFRPPALIHPWTGTRDATRFSAAPLQPEEAGLAQSEDCLYLNLWAPTGPGPYPVFVWIHGGGFTGGHSFAPIFDGAAFARQGIVLVSVAYRLGVFGFMDLAPLLGPSYADSGNNAMRDLVASLQWVNRNIAAFGGDPSRVTVGGESAGAKATAALMALPESRSLFSSAISESGGGGERVLNATQAADIAQTYGDLWRTAHPAPTHGFQDLLSAPAASLLPTQVKVSDTYRLHFPFRSQVGGAFLPQRPVDLIAAGNSAGKRLLIGTNRDESALFLGPHPAADPTARDLGNLDLARFNQVFARYQSIYPDMTSEQLRIRAVTAEEYWVPSVRLADAHTRSGGTTWMYRLDYSEPTGREAGEAYHSLDLSLVWQKPNTIEQSDPAEAPLSLQIHQAWLAFLQGNVPAAPDLPKWSQYDPVSRPTMILAPTSRVEDKPHDAEFQLWNGVL